jgi:hypothetical protein
MADRTERGGGALEKEKAMSGSIKRIDARALKAALHDGLEKRHARLSRLGD